MTWLLVSTYPDGEITIPVPAPSPPPEIVVVMFTIAALTSEAALLPEPEEPVEPEPGALAWLSDADGAVPNAVSREVLDASEKREPRDAAPRRPPATAIIATSARTARARRQPLPPSAGCGEGAGTPYPYPTEAGGDGGRGGGGTCDCASVAAGGAGGAVGAGGQGAGAGAGAAAGTGSGWVGASSARRSGGLVSPGSAIVDLPQGDCVATLSAGQAVRALCRAQPTGGGSAGSQCPVASADGNDRRRRGARPRGRGRAARVGDVRFLPPSPQGPPQRAVRSDPRRGEARSVERRGS